MMGFNERDMVGHSGPAPTQRAADVVMTEMHRQAAAELICEFRCTLCPACVDDGMPTAETDCRCIASIACALAEAGEREREAIKKQAQIWAADPEMTGDERDCMEAFAEWVRARGQRP